MGEVYRAKDRKLGRSVAIKVLPEHLAQEAGRVARFHREAKLLAVMNHPNIAAIHSLEESDGNHFLVLELVEGETLADRLKQGRVPIEQALKVALQIAEALEFAHRKGIIHRDLKPANIKITPGGKVKVLDFGLAKALVNGSSVAYEPDRTAHSDAATETGVILGTAAYMSPEQANCLEIDNRSDIWAFGVVLFEMLTAKPLFLGQTIGDTLANVLHADIDWSRLPDGISEKIAALLRRCLTRERKDRLQTIGEAGAAIRELLADPAETTMVGIGPVRFRKRLSERLERNIPFVLLFVALALSAVAFLLWSDRAAGTPETEKKAAGRSCAENPLPCSPSST